MGSGEDITQLLNRWSAGDDVARDRVAPLIYDELKQIARGVFRRESARHTLQPTALVHEAYEKLVGVDQEWQNRSHFYALAARMMRRLLVNHANARNAEKRGGGALRMTLHEASVEDPSGDEDILALDDALTRLAVHDERQSQVLELHYFGGLTQPEIGEVLEISESTVRREFKLARIWLKKLLNEADFPT
ncbi:MAG: sigma-70 family RNA polymerase sigma factor [Pseudomonadota bacterium]